MVTTTIITFPELRALMGKYKLSQQDVATVCGITYTTYAKKLNNKVDFTFTEMQKIRDFFIKSGENPQELTMEKLFFAWKLHYSE